MKSKMQKMRLIRLVWVSLFFLTALVPLSAQEKPAGKKFIQHQVVSGETLFSIGKKYNVETSVLLQNNPQLVNGLKAGQVLRIPAEGEPVAGAVASATPAAPDHFIEHKVQRKETFYFISRKYNVAIDQIFQYNPGMTQLRKGDILRIPQWTGTAASRTTVPAPPAEKAETSPAKQSTHLVQPGETLFSISRRYNCSINDILALNPEAKTLKSGMSLVLPGSNEPAPATPKTAPSSDNFIQHTISAGETLFSISRKYNVSADQLVELNPQLQSSFPAGKTIRIPTGNAISATESVAATMPEKRHEAREEISAETEPGGNGRQVPAGCLPRQHFSGNNESVHIALLLPLFIEDNFALNSSATPLTAESAPETQKPDSTVVPQQTASSRKFYGSSENFIHFYEGVLLAVDSLQKTGVRVKLSVFDTEQKASKVRQLIAKDQLRGADLIIGPIFPQEQKEASEYATRNQIPMISPLSSASDNTQNNPWFFQINPTRDYIIRKTAEYAAKEYAGANFVALRMGSFEGTPEATLINQVKEKISAQNGKSSFHTYDLRGQGVAGLRSILSADRENVVIIPSANEGDVSVALSNLNNLAGDFKITLLATNRFTQFESIDQEHLHNVQLEYLAPYWIDYKSPVTRSFTRKFRENFKTEPNQFSIQGYDVTFYFVSALQSYGRNFTGCLPYLQVELAQGNYHFKRYNSNGGYMNYGLNVISYDRSYNVVRKTITGN